MKLKITIALTFLFLFSLLATVISVKADFRAYQVRRPEVAIEVLREHHTALFRVADFFWNRFKF